MSGQRTKGSEAEIAALRARVEQLEDACAQAYQLAGEVGAPARVLDLLGAASSGNELPAESFLPVSADECTAVASARLALAQVMDIVEPYLREHLPATRRPDAPKDVH